MSRCLTLTGTFSIRKSLRDSLSFFRRPGQPAARRGAHGSVRDFRGPTVRRSGLPGIRYSNSVLTNTSKRDEDTSIWEEQEKNYKAEYHFGFKQDRKELAKLNYSGNRITLFLENGFTFIIFDANKILFIFCILFLTNHLPRLRLLICSKANYKHLQSYLYLYIIILPTEFWQQNFV